MGRIHIILFALFLLPLCSCEKSETGSSAEVIGFSAISTKALINSDTDLNKEGSTFLVTARSSSGATFSSSSALNAFENADGTESVTYSDGKWTYSPLCYWRANSTYRFRAVWPYDESLSVEDDLTTSGITISNFVTPAAQASQYDLMLSDICEKKTGVSVTSSSVGKVGLTFAHLLCNVCLSVNKDAADLDTFQITRVEIFGIKNSGTYTGSWDVSSGAQLTCNHVFDTAGGNVPDDGSYMSADGGQGWLLIPQDISDAKISLAYKVTHNGSTKSKSLTVSLPTSHQWESGKKYKYKLTLSENYNILLASIDVEEWGSQTIGGTIVIK